eukprot:572574-Ditylum_brightwellii.AAC.1
MKPITKGTTGGVVGELFAPNPVTLTSPALYEEVIASLGYVHAQPYCIIDNQDKIMPTLMKCNKLHLYQAFDTPFARPDIQE